MNNKIEGRINHLNDLAKGGIKEDKFNHEFRDIIDTLESIKAKHSKGEPSKKQLKKIISFLDNQIKTIPNGNFVMINELNSQKNDFQNLLNNFDKEIVNITSLSKEERNRIIDENIANGQITEDFDQSSDIIEKKQIKFNHSEKQTFESQLDLNNLTSYTVKGGDRLWDIVKKQYPKLTKTNKDIIRIINYIVNINTKLEPQKLKHLMRDDKLAWGKKGSDGIAGDTLRVGDILKFPKIKITSEVIVEPQKEKDPVTTQIPKKQISKPNEGSETIEVKDKWQTVGFSKDGKNYIIGKDGEPQLVTNQELTPEFKKSIEKYGESLLLTENINLLLSALTQSGEDVSKEQEKVKKSINSFNPLKPKESSDNIINTIKDIFKTLDIDNKEDININDRISVLKYIRDELDNYELVRKNIIEKQFNSLTKISPEELDAFIQNPTGKSTKIEKILGKEEFKEFQKEIVSKQAEANTYFIENQAELQKQFPNVNINAIKELIINSFVGTFAKIEISEIYIEKNLTDKRGWVIKNTIYNGKGNDEIDLFADIQGIGDWDISDKNSNIGKEALILIGTEIAAIAAGMVTMGAGAYAVNAAVYGTRAVKGLNYLYKAGKLANTSIKGVKGIKNTSKLLGLKASRFAAMSTIEGGSFYAGYEFSKSTFEGRDMDYFNKGLAESIAFMGAFKALNGLYKAAGLTLDTTKPLMNQKVILGKQLIGEGITFSALGLAFEGILFEPGEWTAETIIQAFVMAAAFKGVGISMEKIKFKQKGNGVEAVKKLEHNKMTPSEEFPNFFKDSKGQYWVKKGDVFIKKSPRKPNSKTSTKRSENKSNTSDNTSQESKQQKESTTKSNNTTGEKTSESSKPKESEKTESILDRIKTKYENSPLGFINREFKSIFNKHDFDKGSLVLRDNSGKTISIKKEGDFYKVNGGDLNYTKKDLFKDVITKEHKTNRLIDIAEKNIKNEDIKVGLDKPWYPFGKAKIQIENGKIKKWDTETKKYKDMNPTETKKFLEQNPKIMQEIISKKLDKINLEILDWKGVPGKSKKFIWEVFKNSIFSKGHLKIIGFSSAFTLYDVLMNEEKNQDKLLLEAVTAFALSYIPMAAFGVLVIGTRAFKFAGGKIIDLGIKPVWDTKAVQHVWNNKGKYFIGGATTIAGVKIYNADNSPQTKTP